MDFLYYLYQNKINASSATARNIKAEELEDQRRVLFDSPQSQQETMYEGSCDRRRPGD